MLLVDIILAIILILFVARGWRNGVILALGELIGAVLGFLAARAWSEPLGGFIGTILPGRSGLARFIAFVIVFLIVAKLIGWLFELAASLLKIITSLPLISLVNKLLGAIFGFLGGVVLVGSSVYLVLTFRLDPTLMAWLGTSSVARWTERVFSNVLRFLL